MQHQSDRKKIPLKLLLSVGWPLHCLSLRATFDPKHVHMIPTEELQLGVKRSALFVEAFFLLSAQVQSPHAQNDSFTTGSLTVVDVGDKLAKALELSTQLSLQKSLEGAIKVVNAMRLPSLAERLSLILEVSSTILLSYTLSHEQMLLPLLA